MTTTVLRGAHLFDGTGAGPRDADVLLDDDRVVAVGRDLHGDRDIELHGHTVLPGFIDCHVHVMASRTSIGAVMSTPPSYRLVEGVVNLRKTLAAGVTTARDADGADAGLRQAVADGLIPGPRLFVAISMISQTGGRGDHRAACGASVPSFPEMAGRPLGVADGPIAARRVARQILRAGADVLKIAVSASAFEDGTDSAHMRPDEIAEVVAEAHAANRPVMAHAHSARGAAQAVDAGVDSIEHGTDLTVETIDAMAASGCWLVPTLNATHAAIELAEPHGPQAVEAATRRASRHAAIVRQAHEAGVRIAMGSDAGVTAHGANLAELARLAAAGLSAHEALVAGTSGAAELLGISDRVGTIAPQKCADLIIVEGNETPLDTLPARLRTVVRGGHVVAGRWPQGDR